MIRLLLIATLATLPLGHSALANEKAELDALSKRIETSLEKVESMQKLEAEYQAEAQVKKAATPATIMQEDGIFINQAVELEPKNTVNAEKKLLQESKVPEFKNSDIFLRNENLTTETSATSKVIYQREAEAAKQAEADRIARQQQEQTQQIIKSIANGNTIGQTVTVTPVSNGG